MLAPDIERFIHTARSRRVILDTDLAQLYGVPTKRLNEQFRRNLHRFPEDFAFQLTPEEWAALGSQFATVNIAGSMRSQIATASKRNIRYLPVVFTEHGALMAANRMEHVPGLGTTSLRREPSRLATSDRSNWSK